MARAPGRRTASRSRRLDAPKRHLGQRRQRPPDPVAGHPDEQAQGQRADEGGEGNNDAER
jgi:hypothetical protein